MAPRGLKPSRYTKSENAVSHDAEMIFPALCQIAHRQFARSVRL